jgi:hypothetical protein
VVSGARADANRTPDSRRDGEEAAYHRHGDKGADGEVFGRGFDYTYSRKLVGKVRTEIVVEIDRAQIEPRLTARTIQQSSGKAEFRKWIGSWFEKGSGRLRDGSTFCVIFYSLK